MGETARMRDYVIYDVFTDTPLHGNPLAVVFDAEGLDEAAMQAVAGEFNLSETVFVLPPERPGHTARLRIFTPVHELPFAGHPTVGASIAIANRRNALNGVEGAELDAVLMLEEAIGGVRCVVRLANGGQKTKSRSGGFAEFDLPRISRPVSCSVRKEAVAEALGLSARQVGFENHTISVWSAGVPFVLVPLHDLAAVEQCCCDDALWEALAPVDAGLIADAYVYCRGGVDHKASFHARMFGGSSGIPEDPATGSAVAALSGAVTKFDALFDGHHSILVEQGVEMGRPSKIHLHLDIASGTVTRTRIGGEAVKVAEGRLQL